MLALTTQVEEFMKDCKKTEERVRSIRTALNSLGILRKVDGVKQKSLGLKGDINKGMYKLCDCGGHP
jgi:hypothetical protein